MIHWLGEKTDKAWDDYQTRTGLIGMVCEVHDPELKGHIVIQLEIGDDWAYQLDLGDCTGLSDGEIDARFHERFHLAVDDYRCGVDEGREGCDGPILEDLEELQDVFENECDPDPAGEKQVYTVTMSVEGHLTVNVEASSPKEAFRKAEEEIGYADFSEMEVTESHPVCCEDEDGNLTDSAD